MWASIIENSDPDYNTPTRPPGCLRTMTASSTMRPRCSAPRRYSYWLNADPIGLAGGLNLYVYVGNPAATNSGDSTLARIGARTKLLETEAVWACLFPSERRNERSRPSIRCPSATLLAPPAFKGQHSQRTG